MIAQVLIAVSLTMTPVADNSEATFNKPAHELYRIRPTVDAKCPQWWHLAASVGWRKNLLPKLDEIMWRESRCDLYQINHKDPNKGSWGLMQVNGFWVKYLAAHGILERLEDLQDPSINLRSALRIYNYADTKHGNGWGPWGK